MEQPTINNLIFGDIDGEKEATFDEFVDLFYKENLNYKKIIDDDFYIIQGKKGTGKTILAEYIKNELRTRNRSGDCRYLCNIYKIADIHTQLLKDKDSTELQNSEFKVFQKWFFSLVICKNAIEQSKFLKYIPFTSLGFINNFLKNKYPDGLYKITSGSEEYSVKNGLNLANGTFSMEEFMKLSQAFAVNKYYNQNEKIFLKTKKILANYNTIVFLDDIDSISENINQNKNYIYFLISLIDSIKEFNLSMKSHKIRCKIVLLIRDDIMDLLQSYNTNINKVDSGIVRLNWVKNYGPNIVTHPLMDLILNKIKNTSPYYKGLNKNQIYDKLFKNVKINDKNIIDFMLSFGFGRPREVTKYFNILQEKFPTHKSFDDASIYKKVLPDYSQWFLNELRNELSFYKDAGYITNIFDLLSSFGRKGFYYSNIELFFNRNKEDYPHIKQLKEAIGTMFAFGILGNSEKTQNDKVKFYWCYWHNCDKKVNFNQKFVVHNGIRRALSIF